jgi:hypothetical protein
MIDALDEGGHKRRVRRAEGSGMPRRRPSRGSKKRSHRFDRGRDLTDRNTQRVVIHRTTTAGIARLPWQSRSGLRPAKVELHSAIRRSALRRTHTVTYLTGQSGEPADVTKTKQTSRSSSPRCRTSRFASFDPTDSTQRVETTAALIYLLRAHYGRYRRRSDHRPGGVG